MKRRTSKKKRKYFNDFLLLILVVSSPYFLYKMYESGSIRYNKDNKYKAQQLEEKRSQRDANIIKIIEKYFKYSYENKDFDKLNSKLQKLYKNVDKGNYQGYGNYHVFKELPTPNESSADFENRIMNIWNNFSKERRWRPPRRVSMTGQ